MLTVLRLSWFLLSSFGADGGEARRTDTAHGARRTGGERGASTNWFYLSSCSPLPAWLIAAAGVPGTIPVAVSIAGVDMELPTRDCQREGCPRCGIRGGYAFQWHGPWTDPHHVVRTGETPDIARRRIAEARLGYHDSF